MNKKISLGVAVSLVAIGCAITFVLTWTVSLNIYNSKISGVQEREEIYTKIKEIDSIVRTNYIGTIDDEALIQSILSGYVSGISDKYTTYIPADNYYTVQQAGSGVLVGIGVDAVEEASGYIQITKVYEGSVAAASGIMLNDIITEIDGKNVLSIGNTEALKILKGDEGTSVSVKINRQGEEMSFNLVRAKLEIKSVKGRKIGDYGYVRISTFNDTTGAQFSEIIDSLIEQDVKGFIFDVRQNSGGLVNGLKPILNRLLDEGIIATAKYADGSVKTLIETDSEQSVKLPMTVLVDNGSASASELFSAALRDESDAKLVGTTTYGKAVMQNTYEFKDGSALVLTIAKVYSSRSDYYDGIGLKPDYFTELTAGQEKYIDTLDETNDDQLKKALEVMETLVKE